jgi:hypothetical protein
VYALSVRAESASATLIDSVRVAQVIAVERGPSLPARPVVTCPVLPPQRSDGGYDAPLIGKEGTVRLRLPLAIIVVLAAGPLTACGDDDDVDLGPYIDAVAADFAEPDADSPPVNNEQAQCAAEHAVEEVGEDKIAEYDTPEDLVAATKENLVALDLDAETLDTIAEEIVDCLGGMEYLLDALAGFGLTEDQIACVAGAISEDEFVASVRADIGGGVDEEFEGKIGACASE